MRIIVWTRPHLIFLLRKVSFQGVITWQISARTRILVAITWRGSTRVTAYFFLLPPFCFVEYYITAPAQVLTRGEI